MKYKVYLGNTRAKKLNLPRRYGDKYGVDSNVVFLDMFELKDIPKLHANVCYYLVDEDFIKNLEKEVS